MQRSFTQPRFAVQILRRRLSRSLDRNPIGWLQHYSWAGRITKWGWFAVIMAIEYFVVADVFDFVDVHPFIVLLLLAGIAFTASASFRNERESGALELLLVCPLSVSQIIGGRLRGIWAQFLPSAALVALCINVGAGIERYGDTYVFWWFSALSFIIVPVVGLFFSMTRTNFTIAWLLTLLFGIVVPILFVETVGARGLVPIQVGLGILFWRLLYSRLKHRHFAFAHP